MHPHETTQEDPGDLYGPHTPQIEHLLELATTMTLAEASRLVSPVYFWRAPSPQSAARFAAWFAAQDAVRDSGRSEDWYAARDATRRAAQHVEKESPVVVLQYAVLALLVWDLVGQHGLTQDHLDRLVGPAKIVFGDQIIPN
jgi:hypothetical protein